jgi:hypothetical protein
MKRAFLIVALAFAAAPVGAQQHFGFPGTPGQPVFGAQTLPSQGNAAPSVPPGGLSPSGARPGGSNSSTVSPGYVGPGVITASPSTVPPGGNFRGSVASSVASEKDAREMVSHAGYGSVSAMTKGLDGVWRGTARLDARQVKVEVDPYGAVRAY